MRSGILLVFGLLFASMRAALSSDFQVPPTPNHYVTDGPGALSEATRTALEDELRSYEAKTGHQVIVYIGKTTDGVPLETWTAQTAHTWKIGRHGHDDGVVLFVFMDDHKVRIEVGYGLEGTLTDADAKRIIDEQIVPAMHDGDTDRAVAGGVRVILTTITPTFTGVAIPVASHEPSDESPTVLHGAGRVLAILAFAVPVGFFILIVLLSRRLGRRASGSSGETFLSSSNDDDSSSSDDDFDAGGGDFGGGGASGSW
jgi:uncharacterized protein